MIEGRVVPTDYEVSLHDAKPPAGSGLDGLVFFVFGKMIAMSVINCLVPLFIMAGSVLGTIFEILFLGMAIFYICFFYYGILLKKSKKANFLKIVLFVEAYRKDFFNKYFTPVAMFLYSFFLIFIYLVGTSVNRDPNITPIGPWSFGVMYLTFIANIYGLYSYKTPFFDSMVTLAEPKPFTLKRGLIWRCELINNVPDFNVHLTLDALFTDSKDTLIHLMDMAEIVKIKNAEGGTVDIQALKSDSKWTYLPWEMIERMTTEEIVTMSNYFSVGLTAVEDDRFLVKSEPGEQSVGNP